MSPSQSRTTSWRESRGRASLARYGLLIHSTAGFVDPGWTGKLTLEFSNVGILGITLHRGMKIGHISFTQLTTPADNPYGSTKLGSKYQGQGGPATSKYYLDYQLSNGLGRRKRKRIAPV